MSLLAKDTGDPALYSEATLAEPGLIALRDRVRVTPTEELTATQSRVRVDSESGHREELVDTGVPAADLTEQGRRLRSKFHVLASPRLGSGRAEALASIGRALELDPDSSSSRLVLATLLWEAGLTGEATTALRELLERDPDNLKARAFLGRITKSE